MSFSSSSSLPAHDTFLLNQLVKFGRRPWVHINITDTSDVSLIQYARRVAEFFRLGGMDVAVRYHTKPFIKISQPSYYKDSYADFNVLATTEDVFLERVRLVRGSNLAILGMARCLRFMWIVWPQNPIKNNERIYQLNTEQMDGLIERYTGQTKILERISSNNMMTNSLIQTALLAYRRLISLHPVSERFECMRLSDYGIIIIILMDF